MRVLYAKQLTQSDAACSKQIKLPKNEAKQFVGELKHRQSSTLVVKDIRGNPWSFLCTCYGCQYALSRVGNFAKEFNLKAGDVLVFLEDEQQQLVVSVNEYAPLHLKPTTKTARASHRRKPSRQRNPPAHLPSPDSHPSTLLSGGDGSPSAGQPYVPGTGDSRHQAASSVSLHHALFDQDQPLEARPQPAGQLHASTPSEPCHPIHGANTKRPYHLAQLHLGGPGDGKEEQGLLGYAHLKRPFKRQDVHVTAEAAPSWDTVEAERGQYPRHQAPASSTPSKFTYEHQQQHQLYASSPPAALLGTAWGLSKVPPGALLSGPRPYRGLPLSTSRALDGDFGSPNTRDMSPQLRLLAKQLTKMDIACAHDQVGIVLPREDVLGSGILGMMGQQQQQGEHEGSECSFLELRIMDLGSAEKQAASARDWMSCQLTQSSNRKFWYLTGLGSFLKRHSARDGQVLELSCGVHHGTFSATLR